MTSSPIPTESHPLRPFLPPGARLLMLGSFPPLRARWSMDFFYPNWLNDMWRLMGLIFYGDRDHFADTARKRFRHDAVEAFARERGIALYDTASEVRRLAGNASDKFLEVVRPTDLGQLLDRLPACHAVVTTGQKATDTLCLGYGATAPKVGGSTELSVGERRLRFYRMPSSSRAYPMALERKAEAYRRMFEELGML